jgi:hypothetical protein
MKKYFSFLLIPIIWYFIMCFVLCKVNFINWTEMERISLIFFSIITSLFNIIRIQLSKL